MGDPVEVPRYDLEPIDSLGTAYTIGDAPSPTGEACMWDEIAPLLAELATLREQHNELREAHNRAMTVMSTLTTEVLGLRECTRMRARDDDSHDGKLVLVKHVPYASDEIVFSVGRMQSFGWSYVQAWWPLPPMEES